MNRMETERNGQNAAPAALFDSPQHEAKLHGTPAFPYAVYRGNIPGYIPFYPIHWHDEMEIIFAVRGKARIRVGSETRSVADGDIALVPPQAVHAFSRLEKESLEYFTILFRFRLLCPDPHEEIFRSFFLPVETGSAVLPVWIPAEDARNAELRPYILDLIENRHTADFGFKIKSDLFAVMHLLKKEARPAEGTRIPGEAFSDRLKKIITFVRQNYAREITVSGAARLAGLSESHFMKLFRETAGVSFIRYVKEFRLAEAARMLAENGGNSRKIIDVAAECGFPSPSYFTRAFAEKYGKSPQAFRKAARSAGQNAENGGTV